MYAAAPSAFQAMRSVAPGPGAGSAIAKIIDRMGANDTAPARSPQAMVIIAMNATAATPAPRAAGCGCSSAADAEASTASSAAATTRCHVRPTVFGTSARLVHTAPLLASCAAVAPPSAANSSCTPPTPMATAMPFKA